MAGWRALARCRGIPAHPQADLVKLVERPDGPAFDDGFAQTFEQFLGGELPPVSVPSAVIEALRAALTPEPRRRSVFGWFRRG
jgi:hypothetical protein